MPGPPTTPRDRLRAASDDEPGRVLAALRACARWAAAPGDDVRDAARASALLVLAAGDAAFREGDPGRTLFVVERGRIASRLRSPEGHVVDVGVAGPGDLFGYFEVFDGGPRDCDAVALVPSMVVAVPHPAGLRLLTTHPSTLVGVVDDLLGIVRQQNRATLDRGFRTVEARLAGLLLDAADARGRVLLDGSQTLLAQRLGTARQTLNRTLRALAAQGLVAVGAGGRSITVLDRPRLVAAAGRSADRPAPEVVERRPG